MTETSRLADYALPACTFLEETGIGGFPYAISYCEPYIMLRKQVIEPFYESMPIWKIWTLLGRTMGYGEFFPWNAGEEVAEHLFSTSGVTLQDLKDHPEGMMFGKKEYHISDKIGFSTDSKRIELYSPRMEELGAPGFSIHVEPQQSPVEDPELAKRYPLTLLTGARQAETQGAQLHDIKGLRALAPEAEAEINPVSAKKYDVVTGEIIGLETLHGMIRIKAKVTEDIRHGIVSIPYGWPGSNSNILVDATLRDEVSGYVTMRGMACRIVRLA
jgi:anaerobic selenocysteine-containing dehydrogenase